ncbi:hypothetical protein GQ55_9G257600 [Panicum hallii var. hallii]|uniref:Uncharacterized protein n=1 Tax=Panicum hallii var. hallii TaxID=1504633 RepID=A0A2T7C703_9POAL|nr:hypothetical protein GQ55_9G257600 [Panicum hallii var. hallii]
MSSANLKSRGATPTATGEGDRETPLLTAGEEPKGKLWPFPGHLGMGHQGNLNNSDAFRLQGALGMMRVMILGR